MYFIDYIIKTKQEPLFPYASRYYFQNYPKNHELAAARPFPLREQVVPVRQDESGHNRLHGIIQEILITIILAILAGRFR